ncbi:hypothetical protein LSAT2_006968 [Lamellibrachia satsuma]|nr:hypothetical protein LSAT2_006968 [Lamellibrachia satsuma]
MFFEAQSKNKSLKLGSTFLYQVFPGNTVTWQKVYLRAVKDNELETVKRVVTFFQSNMAFINCQEPHTGNSTLHWACKLGHYDVVLYLLESGANIDQKNSSNQTPLFFACEGWHKDIAHLLIEWGCDVHVKGPKGQTAFETVRNEEFREELISVYEMYSTWVPRVIEGDTELLTKLIEDHASGMKRFNDLQSR